MENFVKVAVPVFLCCLLGTVAPRSMPPVRQHTLERLNVKRTELKQACDAKGENFYEDIQARHVSFTLNLTERFMTWKKEATSTDDVYKLVQERCNKDTTLKEMLKKFVEAAQLCLEEKDRVKEDKLLIYTTRLMELFCAQYTHSNAYSSDDGCLNLVTNAAIDSCKEKYKTDQFIPLPFIYSVKECNDYQKYSECRIEAMKNCKDSTKSAVEAADSIMFHTFYGCQNISVIPEKITMKRSPVIGNESRCNRTGGQFLPINLGFRSANLNDEFRDFDTLLSTAASVQLDIIFEIKRFCIKDETQQNTILQERCFNNDKLKEAFDKIYEASNPCLDEEEPFNTLKKEVFLKQSLNETCALMKSQLIHISIEDCRGHLKIYPIIITCDSHRPFQTVSNFVSFSPTYTPEGCSSLYEIHDLQLRALKDCSNSTKLSAQSEFDKFRTLVGC